jgi:hypothetical protein
VRLGRRALWHRDAPTQGRRRMRRPSATHTAPNPSSVSLCLRVNPHSFSNRTLTAPNLSSVPSCLRVNPFIPIALCLEAQTTRFLTQRRGATEILFLYSHSTAPNPPAPCLGDSVCLCASV